MHNNLIKYIKKISFYSTDADHDWRIMFSVLAVALIVLLGWSIYFSQKVNDDISAADLVKPKGTMSLANEQEDLLKKTITIFEAKAVENKGIISGNLQGSLSNLADPAR